MPNLRDFAGVTSPYTAGPHVATHQHPEGWEPGVRWYGSKGTITGRPTQSSSPEWDVLLKSWGFDPEDFEVDGETVQVRTWDAVVREVDGSSGVRQLWYHRANIRKRGTTSADRVDIEALTEQIRKHRPAKARTTTGDLSLVVALSDTQIGKGEGGGTEGTVGRVLAAADAVTRRLAELRRIHRGVNDIVVLLPGDTVEGCTGFYAGQEFQIDLHRRDQEKVARRLLLHVLTKWARVCNRMTVAAVGGNHGENRGAPTSKADNADVAVVEALADIMSANPEAYGHVSFVIPNDELAVTVNVHGVVVGLIHGHQAGKRPGDSAQKIRDWWKGQAFGQMPVGDCQILVTGHWHSLRVREESGRTHFQCPALDGGSAHHTDKTGEHSSTGILTFLVGDSLGERGWSDMQVVS